MQNFGTWSNFDLLIKLLSGMMSPRVGDALQQQPQAATATQQKSLLTPENQKMLGLANLLGGVGAAFNPVDMWGRPTWQAQLGGVAQQLAQNRLATDMLQRLLGNFNPPQQPVVPPDISGRVSAALPTGLAAGAISPDVVSKAVNMALAVNEQPYDILYKKALAQQILNQPTFEQSAALKILLDLIGPGKSDKVIVRSLNVNKKGEQTPPLEKHDWVFNVDTGEQYYLGPSLERPLSEGSSSEVSRWIQLDNMARKKALDAVASKGYGKLVTLPDGSVTIQWTNPEEGRKLMQETYDKTIQYLKKEGYLPSNWIELSKLESISPEYPETTQEGGGEAGSKWIEGKTMIGDTGWFEDGKYYYTPEGEKFKKNNDGTMTHVKTGKRYKVPDWLVP